MIRFWLAGCLLLTGLPAAAQVRAQTPHRIEVRASGEVTVAADEMRVPLELSTMGTDLGAVKERNDALLKQIFEVLATQKLPQPAIEATSATFDFSRDDEGRNYSPKGKVNQTPSGKGKGFDDGPSERPSPIQLNRHLTLRFDGLPAAAELLAKLTALDAVRKTREVRLSALQPSLKDPAPHQSKARRLAVEACKAKATLLAEASELKLGPAIAIFDEATGSSSYPRATYLSPAPADPFGDPFGRAAPAGDKRSSTFAFVAFQAGKEKSPTDPERLPPGQVTISASVRIVYEATEE
jgi:uncharacterized protein YggE